MPIVLTVRFQHMVVTRRAVVIIYCNVHQPRGTEEVVDMALYTIIG
jgi:hypothetical protein